MTEDQVTELKTVLRKLELQCRKGYSFKRVPHEVNLAIDFSSGEYFENAEPIECVACKLLAVRRRVSEDIVSITVMLANSQVVETLAEIKASNTLFQPRLTINSGAGYSFVYNGALRSYTGPDAEERRLAMLYRKQKCYATGLGVAADWQVDADGKGKIFSEFMPTTEMPPMDFSLAQEIADQEHEILSMKYHSDLVAVPLSEKLARLKLLLDSYAAWIAKRRDELDELSPEFKQVGAENIADCEVSLQRMREGLKLLQVNENVQRAFALANRAMFMQRIHSAEAQHLGEQKERYEGDKEISAWLKGMDYHKHDDKNTKWRPFQLAFILMSLAGIVDEKHADRQLVDLIWFPTGGGKTEAYLGLAAFVIFYRRLAHPDSYGGTNIIMRYTLRLLTAQQFSRAATLICACEHIRREHQNSGGRRRQGSNVLGDEPITIGMWVGGKHTYNRVSEAEESLKALQRYRNSENKFQLLKCPWCGTSLIPEKGKRNKKWGYAVTNGNFVFRCPQEACEFSKAREDMTLPAQVIDEKLYKNPPTLLIGTVDKFALMALNKNIASFFAGRGPELIIQDELHLISGPLGSLVGLYETAIDYICGRNGVSPKIIASTATIRRAKAQCAALYDRDVRQFPAPGLIAGDSYFAHETAIDHEKGKYGRKYIGIMGVGKHMSRVELLLMANLLTAGKNPALPNDDVRDSIWTVTSYFNSMRELGSFRKYVEDDAAGEAKAIAERLNYQTKSSFINIEELTSHVGTRHLNETLGKLEKDKYKTLTGEQNYQTAVDVLLSTNMISVGIDVSRLNVMHVAGQPKLVSEYIQASSRVGRFVPGSVFVAYNMKRSRDRSYYEQFRNIHETIYAHVEPTSATPFSAPARERAMHAVLVAIMRETTKLNANESAGEFKREVYVKDIEQIKEYIIKRFQSIRHRCNDHPRDESAQIGSEIDEFFDFWQDLARKVEPEKLFYGDDLLGKSDGKKSHLLRPYGKIINEIYKNKPTMTSMRNVDSEIKGALVYWKK